MVDTETYARGCYDALIMDGMSHSEAKQTTVRRLMIFRHLSMVESWKCVNAVILDPVEPTEEDLQE